jgi:hypothetical protein
MITGNSGSGGSPVTVNSARKSANANSTPSADAPTQLSQSEKRALVVAARSIVNMPASNE